MTNDGHPGSTQRLGLAAAPNGLCLVQDLVNTAGMSVPALPDLLGEPASAQEWLDGSLRVWAEQTGQAPPRLSLAEHDLDRLRDLRDRLRGRLAGEVGDPARHPVTLSLSHQGGRVTYRPEGDGADGVASLVWTEVLLAVHTGTLARLKTCANPACGAAFYDRSRNGSRVWHDVKICGNLLNLRASRARRRTSAETTPPVA
ncbi:CGNR zinc finger domain-containing protein [Streptomyces olivaceoviridis]